jgi:putative phosphoribosyl transferase
MGNSSATLKTWPVAIAADGETICGDLVCPANARGIVIFPHGNGRQSARNRAVARMLQHGRLGTLLMDLLTPEEGRIDPTTAQYRFEISLLARRVGAAIDWIKHNKPTALLPLGLFGASTGAAAALIAAAEQQSVRAVVSRGGRVDLAEHVLDRVTAATLLIVGGRDDVVLELNRHALDRLKGPARLAVIPGASHSFEEPGALERVGILTANWFDLYLAGHEIRVK